MSSQNRLLHLAILDIPLPFTSHHIAIPPATQFPFPSLSLVVSLNRLLFRPAALLSLYTILRVTVLLLMLLSVL